MAKASVLNEFEEAAVMGAKAVRAFLAYQGSNNRDYFLRGRVGAGAMGAYSRLRATMANEAALRLAASRKGPEVLALMAGEGE